MLPLVLFLAAALALNVSPGPDMLYVISRSLGQGRRAGIVSALGIGVGTLVYTLVTAIGLSALLLSIPILFNAIRYAGALYLAYLGFRMLFAKIVKTRGTAEGRPAHIPLRSVFRQGVTTNVLNPKVALFFLAFLPQFVDQSKGQVALQLVLLGLMFDTSGTSVNVVVATLAGRVGDSLKKRSIFSRIQRILPAFILIGLAISVAL
ncbi:MAG: LysE family translocator [Candidatus Bathyarchaeia archaeon]